MKADFLKRAESDVDFESNEGELIKQAIEESIKSGERINQTITVKAYDKNREVIATFEMIASLKAQQ